MDGVREKTSESELSRVETARGETQWFFVDSKIVLLKCFC